MRNVQTLVHNMYVCIMVFLAITDEWAQDQAHQLINQSMLRNMYIQMIKKLKI